ncbi:MAG: hypothetical protein JWR45_1658 [Blastococcus sp.]|jgi:hypothetical membrane protein|nr:hypothetical protein [Blastococcus sp.]
MGTVTPNRLRWGALAWLLTLQFFVVETIAQLRFEGSYSRVHDVISDLGTADSAARTLMNASFVVQAALIVGGALLLRPVLLRGAGPAVPLLLGAAGVGVLLVGLFPSDGQAGLHATGAVIYLLGGGLGLITLAYAVRPRSEALGTTLALLGLVGTAATVFFVTGVVQYLGEGGTERAAAYVLPLGLALAGPTLWRLAGRADGQRPDRRAERELVRAQRAERERERDEALETAARRNTRPGVPDADDPDEDPWATPVRRGD